MWIATETGKLVNLSSIAEIDVKTKERRAGTYAPELTVYAMTTGGAYITLLVTSSALTAQTELNRIAALQGLVRVTPEGALA